MCLQKTGADATTVLVVIGLLTDDISVIRRLRTQHPQQCEGYQAGDIVTDRILPSQFQSFFHHIDADTTPSLTSWQRASWMLQYESTVRSARNATFLPQQKPTNPPPALARPLSFLAPGSTPIGQQHEDNVQLSRPFTNARRAGR